MCQGRYFFWAQSPEINTNIINILDIPVGPDYTIRLIVNASIQELTKKEMQPMGATSRPEVSGKVAMACGVWLTCITVASMVAAAAEPVF
jgi:hypothetical protein